MIVNTHFTFFCKTQQITFQDIWNEGQLKLLLRKDITSNLLCMPQQNYCLGQASLELWHYYLPRFLQLMPHCISDLANSLSIWFHYVVYIYTWHCNFDLHGINTFSPKCSILHLVCVIARVHVNTCATSLMFVKNSLLLLLSGTLERRKWRKEQKHQI